jgi:predicted SAM-dependent methyltransferase
VSKRIWNRFFPAKKTRERLGEFLKKYSSGLKTLEIGAESRKNSRYFPDLLTLNREKHEGVDRVADAEDLSVVFADGEFDVVVCLSVLEHTAHPERVIGECWRILKESGMLVLSVPFLMPLHQTPEDYWRFTRYGVEELIRGKFETVELREDMNSMETMGYLFHRLFLQCEVLHSRILALPFLLASKFCYRLRRVISAEYGSVQRDRPGKNILAASIHLAAKKIDPSHARNGRPSSFDS